MDYYHHMLKHFGWTWLEKKRHPEVFGKSRKHIKEPTALARAFSKRMVRSEIESHS